MPLAPKTKCGKRIRIYEAIRKEKYSKGQIMNISFLIKEYLFFLNKSLPHAKTMLEKSQTDEEAICNWLQASWELLFESILFQNQKRYLQVYGQGADLPYTSSSRVSYCDKLPTDEIFCFSKQAVFDHLSKEYLTVNHFSFDEFVCLDGDWYSNDGFLDHVLLTNEGQEYVIAVDNIEFILDKPRTY